MGVGKVLGVGAAIAIGGLGTAMALTNPSPQRYQTHATEELVDYLQNTFCDDLPNLFGQDLQDECVELVDERRPQLSQMIADNTQRRNFLFLSQYHTELRPEEMLPSEVQAFVPAGVLPSYQVDTIGAFQRFWLYRARQQR